MTQGRLLAPLIAVMMVAQQVGANTLRDALFLASFPVTDYPYLVCSAAAVSFPAAQWAGRLMARFGPSQVAPPAFFLSGAVFLAESLLLEAAPRPATVLLYVHSTVFGALVVSAYWSFLNERFDPHAARPLLSRVAGGAALGGLLGGVAFGQAGAAFAPAQLLPALAVMSVLCGAGVALLRGAQASPRNPVPAGAAVDSAWGTIRRVPFLSDLAIVSALAACVATLADFSLKAEIAQSARSSEEMIRFFGHFYAATALFSFLVQSALGRIALKRFGLAGSVACHPAAVTIATLIGFVVPAPWRGILPRGADLTLRNSVFRAGYELLYTPLEERSKRSAKALIDVGLDSLGKSIGAALLFALVWIGPGLPAFQIGLVIVIAAAVAELAAIRPLRAGYIDALEKKLLNRGAGLEELAQQAASDFLSARSLVGLDSASILGALQTVTASRLPRSSVTGLVADTLLNPETPESIRRRLPRLLEANPSDQAVSALVAALSDRSFDVRRRCAKTLLALRSSHPELQIPSDALLAQAAREFDFEDVESNRLVDHVLLLLEIALQREPIGIAAKALRSPDRYLRGTALEYLETLLPQNIGARLAARLDLPSTSGVSRKSTAEAKQELLRAHESSVHEKPH